MVPVSILQQWLIGTPLEFVGSRPNLTSASCACCLAPESDHMAAGNENQKVQAAADKLRIPHVTANIQSPCGLV